MEWERGRRAVFQRCQDDKRTYSCTPRVAYTNTMTKTILSKLLLCCDVCGRELERRPRNHEVPFLWDIIGPHIPGEH